MSYKNKKKNALAAICGMLGFGVAYITAPLHPILTFTAPFFMIWGIYYFVRGTYPDEY